MVVLAGWITVLVSVTMSALNLLEMIDNDSHLDLYLLSSIALQQPDREHAACTYVFARPSQIGRSAAR
jgi:hypothetical protein